MMPTENSEEQQILMVNKKSKSKQKKNKEVLDAEKKIEIIEFMV